MPEDKLVAWQHRLSGHESEPAPGDSEGQGSLALAVRGVAESQTRLRDSKTWQSTLYVALRAGDGCAGPTVCLVSAQIRWSLAFREEGCSLFTHLRASQTRDMNTVTTSPELSCPGIKLRHLCCWTQSLQNLTICGFPCPTCVCIMLL